ncbi:MAG: hypothetical protein KDK62_01725 [Chlamydiia bacterium]|nr:hypothetical protein [Chlamydiia bacterium]
MLKENIRSMDVAQSSVGMDIVIVSVQDSEQEAYWQKRLHKTRGQVVKNSAYIIVVQEDWPGGAGNGLGSLYAYQKAREKGYVLYKTDIFQKQREGKSIALYHTAGEGKRLYPLTAAEYGNKSAVKLPGLIKIEGKEEPITLLEAAIKQTSIYAPSRKGRLSVFWADQLFVPANTPLYSSTHHADILVKMTPMPTEEEWIHKELNRYGLIALDKEGVAKNIDKADWATLKHLINEGKISISGGVGLSLGSFSLSTPLTFALIQEFQPELIQKNVKMDSDPYIWMPFTLDQASYIEAVQSKGISAEEAKNHHLRIQYFKNHFLNKYPDAGLFGVVDIGVGSYFWDLGNLECYYENLMKMTQNTVEGYLLRDFFGHEQNKFSIVQGSQIESGEIKNSIVIDSKAQKLNIENTLIIGSYVTEVSAKRAILYKVLEETPSHFTEKTVRADVALPSLDKVEQIFAEIGQVTKRLWNVILKNNLESFSKLQEKVQKESPEAGKAYFEEAQKKISSLTLTS